MTESEIAAQLVGALTAEADREAGSATALVSVNIDALAPAAAGAAEAQLVRKTRTLVFMSAEWRTSGGDRIASASSVHKVLGA
jgi:acyl-coenzyme A thioesterase PaaI-like protein